MPRSRGLLVLLISSGVHGCGDEAKAAILSNQTHRGLGKWAGTGGLAFDANCAEGCDLRANHGHLWRCVVECDVQSAAPSLARASFAVDAGAPTMEKAIHTMMDLSQMPAIMRLVTK